MSCCSGIVADTSGSREKNKINFSQTFNLLSRFLKNNPTTNSSFGDLTLTGMGSSGTNKLDEMIIFYRGQVIVLDDLPADKATQIINLAAAATHNWISHPHPHTHLDLPIARKASLARFLQKRKERITARAPYQQEREKKPRLELSDDADIQHQS